MSEPGGSPATGPVTTRLLSFDEFRRHDRQWDELLRAGAHPTPFMTHAWLRLWWEHFGAGQEFVAVVVLRDTRWVAAAALALRPVRSLGRRLRVAEVVGTGPVPTRGMGLADKVDFPVRAGDLAALETLIEQIFTRVDAEVFDIKGFDESSLSGPALSNNARPRYRVRRFPRSCSPFLPLPASWDEVLRSRSGNFRKHLRKYRRGLEQRGTVEISRLEKTADADAWIADMIAVNEESWKAERGTNLLRHPRIRAFVTDLIPALARDELLDLWRLCVDGRAVAYELCFDVGGRIFSYNGSYRREFARVSPGTVLTASVVEAACARGRREYDMLRGRESYKTRWSEELRSEVEVAIAAPTLAARFHVYSAMVLKNRLKRVEWINRAADRLSGLRARFEHRS
jgi:CelD/BcsL family acetyltransferase involved in cellulose biosynthesis